MHDPVDSGQRNSPSDAEAHYRKAFETLTRAGQAAIAADEPRRAQGVLELAVEQWRALGDDARVDEVVGLLASLP